MMHVERGLDKIRDLITAMIPGEGIDQSALEAYEDCLSRVKLELLDVTRGIMSFGSDSTELTTRERRSRMVSSVSVYALSSCTTQFLRSQPSFQGRK